MAKQALQRVLEDTIGQYVRGLDPENLNVAIWSGKIELNALGLNVDAVNLELDSLALPFKVMSGGFESFHAQVPWTHLASSPVILRLGGLRVVVEPRALQSKADPESISIEHAKEQRHDSIEHSNKYREQKRAVRKLAGTNTEDSSSQSGYVSKLVRRIIENIQVEISDVHISLSGEDGSAGVVLESLSLGTTDKDGNRKFVDRTSGSTAENLFLYQALELKGFGIYLDEPSSPATQHSYILAPFSFTANLRQTDATVCMDYEKYKLSSELSTVSIEVTRNQIDVAEKISQIVATKRNGSTPLFPEYRPLAPISRATAKEWFRYAKRCISRMNGRSSWAEFFRAFKKRKMYIELYKRHIYHNDCSWLKPLSKNEESSLAEIEHDRTISISGLMLWRDLADSQVEMEKSKRSEKDKGKEKSWFFSKKTSSKESDDDTPIELTTEELKVLQDLSMQSFADDELSKDSKLCDASFILKSLNIVLTSYHSQQIAALHMGEVGLGLNATADGAFAFNYHMFDLQIQDLATENSLFPNVLRSLPTQGGLDDTEKSSSVHLQFSKSKTGDQKLKLRVTAFEAVASPIFFIELLKFAKASPTATSAAGNAMNSAAGSYDGISNALVNAWKAKTETKVSWVADVAISAPILVVPQTCTDTKANILVLDLGRLRLQYGQISLAENVKQWFQDNKANRQVDVSYESVSLATSELTFKVATASDWLQAGGNAGSIIGSDIIAPISANLDVGIEQSHDFLDPPRVCCISVIPSITFLFSPAQGKKLLPVVKAWGDFAKEMKSDLKNPTPTDGTGDSTVSLIEIEEFQAPPEVDSKFQDPSKTDEEYLATFFFRVGFQRLSTILTMDENNKLEAHLVSVYASTVVRSNGSSSSNLRMGWFWILDMLESDITRNQRLLAHSRLTKDPIEFAEGEKYDMLEHLKELGVFKEDYVGSTDLADISFQKLVSEYGKANMEDSVDQILDVRFSSLFIHFNPKALKALTAMIKSLTGVMRDDGNTVGSSLAADQKDAYALAENATKPITNFATEVKLLINFEWESLDVYLNSPRDDLPKFRLSVDRGGARVISGRNEMNCHVSLQNVSFEDIRPEASHRQYRHLVDQGTRDTSFVSGDLFVIDYAAGSNSTSVELVIGSPQLVLIPDAVSDLVAILQVEKDPNPSQTRLEENDNNTNSVGGMTSTDQTELGMVEESEASTPHKYSCSVKTQLCSIILVDLGCEKSSEAKTEHNEKEHSQLMETIVLQGIFDAMLTMDANSETGEMTNAGVQSQAKEMEIFTSYGKEMMNPIQILEPIQITMEFSINQNADGGTDAELSIGMTTDLEFFLSLQNVAMLGTIVDSLSSFRKEKKNGDVTMQQLSTNEEERIERLSLVLDETNKNMSIQRGHSEIDQLGVDQESIEVSNQRLAKTLTTMQVTITMTQSRITVINDLQGLDEALFRVSVAGFIASGKVMVPVAPNGMKNMTFDFHMEASILADYFDSSISLWSNLLVIPWGVNLKIMRSPSRRFNSPRLSSTVDLESLPCHIAFAAEFLVSLTSATKMWSVFCVTTAKENLVDEKGGDGGDNVKKRLALSSAARNLLTSLPYAIENHCGCDAVFSLPEGSISHRKCRAGSIQYFRFQPPKGRGYGGRRMYGQDVEFEKSVILAIDDCEIKIPHLDSMLGSQKHVHKLSRERVLLTFVVREGKTTVLHLTSNVSVFNHSSIPFDISIGKDDAKSIGTCNAHNEEKKNTALTTTDGVATKQSNRFNIPMDMLTVFSKGWSDSSQSPLFLTLSPQVKTGDTEVISGALDITSDFREISKAEKKSHFCSHDLPCKANAGSENDAGAFVVQVWLEATVIDGSTIEINVFLQPRAVIENLFPIEIYVRTKMPNTFSSTARETGLANGAVYDLHPGSRIEVFTGGPSIGMAIKPSGKMNAGSHLTWADLEVPLTSESRLTEPMTCLFPFSESQHWKSEFFVAEGYECLDQLSKAKNDEVSKNSYSKPAKMREDSLAYPSRSFYVTVCCYGVDHTGDILFEKVLSRDERISDASQDGNDYHPFGAFGVEGRRLTMLPEANSSIRLLQSTTECNAGYRATLPFTMDDLVIGEGGVNALAILWENRKSSGYFAYRRLVNEHQSEIHIVPEYIFFNGSNETVIIMEKGMEDIKVEAGKTVSLKCESRLNGLELALNFVDRECKTKYVRVDQLSVKMEFVHSKAGTAVGSVCVQTALDTHGRARLVVKIGEIITRQEKTAAKSLIPTLLADDFIRFRMRCTEFKLVLNESQLKSTAKKMPSNDGPASLMSINYSGLSVDIQRVFKEQKEGGNQKAGASAVSSPERCQISMVMHQFQVKDLTKGSKFPVVFGCSSNTNFIDLRIRTRGPLNADIVNVDRFDLSLAHLNGKSENIQLSTSEEYLWKVVDLMSRIAEASKDEVGDYRLVLTEDEDKGGYIAKIEDGVEDSNDEVMLYSPPRVDRMYDVESTKVSPFAMLVSFHRTPDESRYEMARNVQGAALTNYFTRQLKFSINDAVLKFARYEKKNLKGPPDRLVESLGTVYASRMKFKVLTLLSSASLQDWKFLAAREGDDEYVEGDVLRATGNLAGMGAGALLGTVGQGLGGGVSKATGALGDGIENVTGLVGARKVGAGINTVVSGVGDGVGSTLTGVGSGAGKIIQGAGQGVGQVVGGVLGGAFQMGKGLGEGIIKGDATHLMNEVGKGANQIGGGVAGGAGSIWKGTTDGVLTAGKGLVSGGEGVVKGTGSVLKGAADGVGGLFGFGRKKAEGKK